MKNLVKHILPVSILLVIVIVFYSQIINSYFEQDEWHSFGHYIYVFSNSLSDALAIILKGGLLAHFTPLSLLTKSTIFNLFGLDEKPYFVVSILLHSTVVVSLYFFLLDLLKKKKSAFLGALFFALSASNHQAITWIGTFEGILGSTLFGILSLLTYKRRFWLSLVFIFVSLLYRENALTFYGILIVSSIFIEKNLNRFLKLLSVAFMYLFLKFSYIFFGQASATTNLTSQPTDYLNNIVYNLATLPLKFISQIFVPQDVLINAANWLTPRLIEFLPDPNKIWVVSNDYSFELIALLLGAIVTLLVFLTTRKNTKILFLYFTFNLFSSLPLVITNKYLIYPDSRYFYTASIAASIYIGYLFSKFDNPKKFFYKTIVVLFFALLVVTNVYYLQKTFEHLLSQAKIRKDIVYAVNSYLPILPQKSLVYVESDRAHYGINKKILPFQSGFGQLLLVNYEQKQKIPVYFFRDEFLWGIQDQGYKEADDFGFGFFYDQTQMENIIEKEKIPVESVYAFSFNSNNRSLSDISLRVRNEYLSKKLNQRQIFLQENQITSTNNQNDIKKLIDSNKNSYWSSLLAYYYPQSITIDFGKSKNISLIRIDSSASKDQNEVGFLVEGSQDKIIWQELYKVERRLPNEKGITEIYVLPKPVRFVTIHQIGYHQFAPWVINELQIYEVKDQ